MIYRFMVVLLCVSLLSCKPGRFLLSGPAVEPGEKLLVDAGAVWKDYDCDNRGLPFLIIEQHLIEPVRLHAGEEFHHHFAYAMCPSRSSRTLRGHLYRKIYYKDAVVFQDVSNNFEFRPGKWAVDAFIRVPPQAQPGTYFVKLLFNAKAASLERNLYFIVER